MNICFITFGCKVNLYETENMRQLFSERGYGVSGDETGADVFAVNSCAVTEESVRKLRKELRRLRREHPDAVIMLTGCFPQAFPAQAAGISEADIIIGTKDRAALPDMLENFLKSRKRTVNIAEHRPGEPFEPMCNRAYENNTRAFVKIQDGCNMNCAYCVIPRARGDFRSKPLGELVSEVRGLAAAGYKEVVLTGINLSFYGVDLGLGLADAVETVCAIDGIERVRLGSLEPELLTDTEIARLAGLEKLCPQFHLSLQSGCDKILSAMGRRYTSAEYEHIVQLLREKFPDCAITTDIMVGFPGETEDDFADSLRFAERMGFAKAHIFPYSRREGTPAAEMPEQVPEHIKRRRAAVMGTAMELCREKFMQAQVGNVFPVLFEREKADGVPHGYTPNYTPVKICSKNDNNISLRNRIFYVKIVRSEENFCIGEILDRGE